MKHISALLLLSILIGCSSQLDKQVAELVEAKNTWIQKSHGHDYSFHYLRRCFCRYDNREIVIKVSKGEIVSARFVNSEYVHEQVEIETMPTMKQIFQHIFELIKHQEREKDIKVRVTYDEKYGHPTNIEYKRPHVMDGSASLRISSVEIL